MNKFKIFDEVRNNDPYEGEGNLLIVEILDNGYRCLVVSNKKFPQLNGGIEEKSFEDLEEHFYKIQG